MKGKERSINTGGGAYINGGVQIRDGDFVGRDQYKQYYISGLATGKLPPPPKLPDLWYSPSGSPRRRFGKVGGRAGVRALPDLFLWLLLGYSE